MTKKIMLAAAMATLGLIGALHAAEQSKSAQAKSVAASCCDGGECCAPGAACCSSAQ